MSRIIVASSMALSLLFACGRGTSSVPSVVPSASASSQTAPSGIVLRAPEDVLLDRAGALYISDFSGDVIVRLDGAGALSAVAGTGVTGYGGDGGPAADAQLYSPTGMVFDPGGNLVFADHDNGCIRRIDGAGVITRIAGVCGHVGYSGDGGPALRAHLNDPIGIVYHGVDLYFADEQNGRVRRIDARGVITTVAGGGPEAAADGRPATHVHLRHPSYVLFGSDGRLYFSDFIGNRVWAIDEGGTLHVVAGNGENGYAGDGGLATDAELSWPTGLAFDDDGNLYISDSNNNAVRMVGTDGIITTIAGNGNAGSTGDGGPATDAEMNAPAGLAFDDRGDLYVADQGNGLIRLVDGRSGIISTVAGGP